VATAEAEQVVAAIRPQTWVDGKILGLSALTLVLLFLYVGPPAVAFGLLRRLDADLPALPAAAADPGLLAALVVFAGLGFLLWFTFFAAVAATVDDPNNSSRGGWLMLPLLPLGLAFAVVRDPDTLLARVLGLLPPTAPAVMPVRMLLTEVAAWEVLLAVALLASSIALLRRAAVKVFHLGMLMYGKEPTWREIWRRVRETG
jgi:ABC-2 type transport system permease protein